MRGCRELKSDNALNLCRHANDRVAANKGWVNT
jgi:hypothetical protein